LGSRFRAECVLQREGTVMNRLGIITVVGTFLVFGCTSDGADDDAGSAAGKGGSGTSGGTGGGTSGSGTGGTAASSANGTGYLECDYVVRNTSLPSGRMYDEHTCMEQTYPVAFPEAAHGNCKESGTVMYSESTTEHCPTDPTTPSVSCIGIGAGSTITNRWNYDIFTSIDPAATGDTLAQAQQTLVGLYGSGCVFGGVFTTYNIDDGQGGANN
jgi:hypothetical protein